MQAVAWTLRHEHMPKSSPAAHDCADLGLWRMHVRALGLTSRGGGYLAEQASEF
jgi:hypothetical protein